MVQVLGIVGVSVSEIKSGVSKAGVAWARARVQHKEGHAEVVAFGMAAKVLQAAEKVFLSGIPREETYEVDGATRTKLVVQVESIQAVGEESETTPLSLVGAGVLASEPRATSKGHYLSRVAFRYYRGGKREDVFLSVVTPQAAGAKGEAVVALRGRVVGNIVTTEALIKGQRVDLGEAAEPAEPEPDLVF